MSYLQNIQFKGKLRLAKLLFSNKIKNAKDILIKGKYHIVYKVPNLKEIIGLELFVNGIYEEENINFIIGKLPNKATFVDIGANIGTICIPIAKLRPDVKVIAIEASSRICKYLYQNKELNQLNNLTIINALIGNSNSSQVNFYSPKELFGKGSPNPIFTQDAEQVDAWTLDNLLNSINAKNIDFVKIDIEGNEYKAFLGAQKLLIRKDAPDILFEFDHWSEKIANNKQSGLSQQCLVNFGYKIFNLKNQKKTPSKSIKNNILTEGATELFATKNQL